MRLAPQFFLVLMAVGAVTSCGLGGVGTGGGAASCASSTRCVNDTDCPSGSRCNGALSPPACQPLYCGGTGTACSDGYFCASQVCAQKACFAPAAGHDLFGSVVPTTTTYFNQPDGGSGNSVYFSDDARNDCTNLYAHQEYGKSAVLSFSGGISTCTTGQTLTLITDVLSRQGKGPNPNAVFMSDSLSDLDLRHREGTVTIVHLPTPTEREFVVSIHVADGGLDGTYTVTPLCP